MLEETENKRFCPCTPQHQLMEKGKGNMMIYFCKLFSYQIGKESTNIQIDNLAIKNYIQSTLI